MSATTGYDVLIVGARVAGASLGLALARQGRRVLLVDRDSFPSDTLSTHFMGAPAVGELRALGVLDAVLAAGFRRITRHRGWMGDCALEGPAGPGGAFSLAPRRAVIDKLLIDRAVAAGAHFASETKVESLLRDGDRVRGAVIRPRGGEPREVRALLVAGADGKQSKVAEWVGAQIYNEVPGVRPGYYGYFHGIQPMPEATLELFFGSDRIGFFFPMRPDEDCLGLELQPEDFEDFRKKPEAAFLERYRAFPLMEKRMRGATLEGRIQGVRAVANHFRKPYGDGWVLTGDAAYLKDPSSGSGIGDALIQSRMLAEAVAVWFEGADWEATMSDYHARRDVLFQPFYEATLAFTQAADPPPAAVARLSAALCLPSLSRMVATAVPAHLDTLFGPAAPRVEALARMFGAEPAPASA